MAKRAMSMRFAAFRRASKIRKERTRKDAARQERNCANCSLVRALFAQLFAQLRKSRAQTCLLYTSPSPRD
eukprot:10731872-Alexandrium_andersonii.AAC.1